MASINKVHRIIQELQAVGVTALGRAKFTSRYLPTVMHDDEHIQGAVYGRYSAGAGLLRWTEGMLVATDRRILFLDRKPGYHELEELTYDIVSGLKKTYAWPFASITLYTRVGNYTLRYVNKKCAAIFMHYVELRRLESPKGRWYDARPAPF